MDCSECREIMPLIPGEDLDDDVLEEALTHIRECDQCRTECGEYTFLRNLLSGMKSMDDTAFNWEQFSAETAAKAWNRRKVEQNVFPVRYAARFARAALFLITAGVCFYAGMAWKSAETAQQDMISDEMEAPVKEKSRSADREPREPSGVPLREIKPWEVPGFLRGDNAEYYNTDMVYRDTGSINQRFAAGTGTSSAGGAWLGLQVGTSPDGRVAVREIITGGPSSRSGIRKGDIIISCSNRRI